MLRNIILAVVFVAAVLILTNVFLNLVTQHGKEITVPDFTNQTFSEAKYNAGKAGVRVEIADSVYVRRLKRGVVFSQNPPAGTQVKKGRRIFLTTNAKVAKEIKMPFVAGYSMRQAKAELMSRGLSVGKLIYVDDIATNNVIKQLYNNHEIKAGTPIESGSKIDLVVGLNPEDGRTYAPDVIGMKYMRAVDAIQNYSLNVAKVEFDKGIKTYTDSLNAVVYKQSPASSSATPLAMGSGVDLYLGDESKLKK